jgi:hypothetical protein
MHKDPTGFFFPTIAAWHHGIKMENKSSHFKKCNAWKTTLCEHYVFFKHPPFSEGILQILKATFKESQNTGLGQKNGLAQYFCTVC